MLKLLFVVAVVALATYATIRLIQRNGLPPNSPPPPSPFKRRPIRRPPPPRPLGPDDDDDFLRDLDRKRRQPEDPDS